MKIPLYTFCHARSGDKGGDTNVGLISYYEEGYEFIKNLVTAERVKAHFGSVVKGEVIRYELPNLWALNFILKDSLSGGGSESLQNDAQGKTHGQGLLYMEIDVPDTFAEKLDFKAPV